MANRILAAVGGLLVVAGAAGILVGALSPWANVILFKNIELNVSGLLFAGGGLCLAVALLVLLGMRRSAPLCLAGALLVLHWAAQARVDVPRRVRHQVIGAQMALFPLNRLLDQFHIPSVEVGNYGIPDPQLLAPGLTWTADGALALLLGGLLGLPSDPALRWVYLRVVRARCRACGARWPLARAARHCPACGADARPRDGRHCPQCDGPTSRRDRHCIACGHALSS